VSLFGGGSYDAALERADDVPFEEQLRGLEDVIVAGKVGTALRRDAELPARERSPISTCAQRKRGMGLGVLGDGLCHEWRSVDTKGCQVRKAEP
jgi:hypothetical protein